MERTDLLIVGCGPAGATAAREAARSNVETVVIERDATIGRKRVCAAGLRPGFCQTFDLPRSIVHCDTPRLALFDADGTEREIYFGPGHTSTREELDGTMAALAAREGAVVLTQALFRTIRRTGSAAVVEYADLAAGVRRNITARWVFFACGATARFEAAPYGKLAMHDWRDGLMTTLQYRVHLDRPAISDAYRTLELHYYRARDGRQIIGWMFPKRDHLAVGLGVMGKIDGLQLSNELDALTERIGRRLYANTAVRAMKREGSLLYGGMPRRHFADDNLLVGGTAAGLVDATNGEGIFEAAMSGRLAAEAVVRAKRNGDDAGARYTSLLIERFGRRLIHRVLLSRYLEAQPGRYRLLFEQLARSPRLAEVLLNDGKQRTMSDRLYLYLQALRFGVRTFACHG
jgi:geranylgeranyl diphosphate/geranylgeranyl-bacteriochlorophyllide a reductase